MSKEQGQRSQNVEFKFTENCGVINYSNFALINSSEEFLFNFGSGRPA